MLTGRATLFGAMAAGEPGALRALEILSSELVRAMQLCGVRSSAEIGPHLFRVEVAHVLRRAEYPLERVVVALGGAAAVHVVAHQALEAIGHVEDHADERVGGDLHARSAHDAHVLIFAERFSKIAAGLLGGDAERDRVLHGHRRALRHVLQHEVRRVAEQRDASLVQLSTGWR